MVGADGAYTGAAVFLHGPQQDLVERRGGHRKARVVTSRATSHSSSCWGVVVLSSTNSTPSS